MSQGFPPPMASTKVPSVPTVPRALGVPRMSQGFPPKMGSTKVLSVPQSHVHWESLGCPRDSHHQWALPRSCLSHSPTRSPRDVPGIPTTNGLYQGPVCPTVPCALGVPRMYQGFPPPMGSTKVLSVPQSQQESPGCPRDSHHHWPLPRSCLSHCPTVPPGVRRMSQGFPPPLASTKVLSVPQSYRESPGCPRDSHHHWPLPRSCLSHSHTRSPRDVPGVPTTIGLYQGPVCPTVIPGVPGIPTTIGLYQGPVCPTVIPGIPGMSQGFPPPLASTKVLSVPQSYRESPGCPWDSHHHWALPRSCLSHSPTGMCQGLLISIYKYELLRIIFSIN